MAPLQYHVAADVGYVRYFTAFIYEFQFYRALCLEAGNHAKTIRSAPVYTWRERDGAFRSI